MMMGRELVYLFLLSLVSHPLISLKFTQTSSIRDIRISQPFKNQNFESIIKSNNFPRNTIQLLKRWKSSFALCSSSSYNNDILFNDGIRKSIIRSGSGLKFARPNNTVEISWKIFRSDGTLAHDSSTLEEPFQFQVEANPSEVIRGWDLAVQTMSEGEISRFEIPASSAFGATGLVEPISIRPNEDITCELQLVRIVLPDELIESAIHIYPVKCETAH